jgi:microcystin degradation protein MlrC
LVFIKSGTSIQSTGRSFLAPVIMAVMLSIDNIHIFTMIPHIDLVDESQSMVDSILSDISTHQPDEPFIVCFEKVFLSMPSVSWM